jgi:hypothetical protein
MQALQQFPVELTDAVVLRLQVADVRVLQGLQKAPGAQGEAAVTHRWTAMGPRGAEIVVVQEGGIPG